ncbi:tryptophan synthase, alpha subunit [Thermodesulfatator indicus DSM 15286]|uniref:Tryptophan synthase alpha chain n=1 Tax=Thermodesulfatator indicus (strain DSM 15286 / JCM 11887 / CIR29812) TaxID=667014 RepID=F8ACJ3_THEID|nr:tryptophan synthase subunit alpha [Thermodesulfatator indicus]AEH44697.1 tryptophan synthase, alpha subunit [Thermodesulfatator indicus DSM 15286]
MTRGARAVEDAIRKANERGEAALIPFIEGGDPDLSATEDLLWALAEAGADVIELGFPFSDPLADGPVIQEAAQRALRHNPTIDQFLDLVAKLRQKGFKVPLVIMGYLNPFFRYGLENFARRSRDVGLDGAIIPDLPLEEAKPWLKIARKHKLASILLAAPTTPPERLEKIAKASSGFLYYVSITGITGTKKAIPEELALKLDLAKELSPVPVAVGFGISNPEQVKALSLHADAIIVGSAIVKLIARHAEERKKLPELVGRFVKELKEATKR